MKRLLILTMLLMPLVFLSGKEPVPQKAPMWPGPMPCIPPCPCW